MKTKTNIALALWIIVGLFPARHATSQREDPALLLARTCVSERSWRISSNDCAAIYEIARHRSETRGVSLERALRDLSPHLHGDDPLARPWLRHLNADGGRPEHWRAASWGRRRVEWLATLQEAHELVAGDRAPVCERPPSAWGSRQDVRRREMLHPRIVWERIDCGPTVNLIGEWVRR